MYREINLSDKHLFDYYLSLPIYSSYYASELQFVNIICWKEEFFLKLKETNEYLLIIGKDGDKTFFFPPLATNSVSFNNGLSEIKNYFDKSGEDFFIKGFTQDLYDIVDNIYLIIKDRDCDEYLHQPSDLIFYKGKKFHKKRNLYHQFKKKYSYQFISYEPTFKKEVIALLDKWLEKKQADFEKQAIIAALDNLQTLDLFCDILFINNQIEAFAIGTITKTNVGIMLFEKANDDLIGIYTALETLTAEKHFANTKFINRQEDMGIPSLRKSKMSYHPVDFVRKINIKLFPKKELIAIYKSAFNDTDNYIDFFFNKRIKHIYSNYIKNNEQIVCAGYYFDQTYILHDELINCAFLTSLSTLPEFRRHGFMTCLLKSLIQRLYKEGYEIAVLNPTNIDNIHFYQHSSFIEFANNSKDADVSQIKLMKTTDAKAILEIYNEFCKDYNFYPKRSEQDINNILEITNIDSANAYLAFEENKPIGYVISDGDNILEKCIIGSLIDEVNVKNMLRIINIKSFLQKFYFTEREFELSVKITDDIIEENNLILQITIENHYATVIETTTYQYTITIAELTAKLLSQLKAFSFDIY